jgi:acyl carrier protein
METVAERTIRIIAETLGTDPAILNPASDLQKDLGADSLDVVETAVSLEKEFNVTIPDERLEQMRKVQDFIEYFNIVVYRLQTPLRVAIYRSGVYLCLNQLTSFYAALQTP